MDWHAYFRVPEANNDFNVLYGSSLFDDVIVDRAPEAPFVVNGRTYKKGYYSADGIYPTWATFVKTYSIARDEKTLKFKRVQESLRKDIARAFKVLQGIGYQQKDKNKAKNDKTEHGNGKSAKGQSQSQQKSKSKSKTKPKLKKYFMGQTVPI
ncbi:hypothetical protein Tco_0585726 [Tanacetum coccineum]